MILISVKKEHNYNAGHKASQDIVNICNNIENITEHSVEIKRSKKFYTKVINNLNKILFLKNINRYNEELIIQLPFSSQNIILKELKNISKNKKIIFIIHDIEGLRYNNSEVLKDELDLFNMSSGIVVHNNKMKEYLVHNGINNKKIYVLELFDYLCEGDLQVERKVVNTIEDARIVYAGNLKKEKSPFLYQLDNKKMKFKIDVFGIGIEADINDKISFKGKLSPEELPNKLTGNLGLVWDGFLDESDENITYKNYTKYNNPHKLSCYISAGLPVIVWKKSAIADFVQINNIGYVISNIYEINDIDLSDYELKLENVLKLKDKVRNGYFTKSVIKKISHDIKEGVL